MRVPPAPLVKMDEVPWRRPNPASSFVFSSTTKELAGFGRLHGTSSIFTNGAGGTRMAYRFTNGGSLSYYSPGTGTGAAQWQGTAGSCYTITATDKWSGCVKHSGTPYDTGNGKLQRNLSY